MTPENFFHAVELIMSLGIVMWFFAYPWQSLCVDISRQRYFELRDRLFRFAMQGHIGFDNPLYEAFREWLNSRIRYAHKNVLSDVFIVHIVHKGKLPEIPTLYDEFMKIEDDTVRHEMLSIYRQAIQFQIMHMIIRSPIALLALTISAPIMIVAELVSGTIHTLFNYLMDVGDELQRDLLPEFRRMVKWE